MRQGHDKLRIEYRYVILDENDEVVGRLHQDFAAAHNQLREIEDQLPPPPGPDRLDALPFDVLGNSTSGS